MPTISIIVPVYNGEKYLDDCVRSLVDQTFENLEIILIDDGSTDRTLDKCMEWSRRDSRILVFHQENAGIGAARNTGLKHAKGTYIGFVDSDDWCDPDMYAYLLSLLQNHPGVKIAKCKVLETRSRKRRISSENDTERVLDRETLLKIYFRVNGEKSFYWVMDKLIDREILDGFQFIEGTINEDVDADFRFINAAGSMVVSDRTLYYYYINHKGVTKSPVTEKDREYIDVWKRIETELAPTDEEMSGYSHKCWIRANFTILTKMCVYGYDRNNAALAEWKKSLKSEVRKNFKTLLCDIKMPVSRKIMLFLVCM